MKYFESVITFVDEHLIWAVWLFLAAVAVELIVFLVRSKSNYGFETESFYISVVSNVTGLLGLYVLTCLCVGLFNYIKTRNHVFRDNYYNFLESLAGESIMFLVKLILCGGGLAGMLWLIYITHNGRRRIIRVLAFPLGMPLLVVALSLAFILIFVILEFICSLPKIAWFMVTCLFQSAYQFIVKYWKWILLVFFTPGVIYSAINALVNYIISLKDEVFLKDRS